MITTDEIGKLCRFPREIEDHRSNKIPNQRYLDWLEGFNAGVIYGASCNIPVDELKYKVRETEERSGHENKSRRS